MQLIYLAPLTWSSFAQRPHMFVRWFHEKYQCPVLWVNPYPTRFPALSDLKRIAQNPDSCDTEVPEWLDVVSPKSLPIEPLAGSQFINALLWQPLLQRLCDFSSQDETLIAIGKPSALALVALAKLPNCKSFYDAMDDYPQFYRGLSRSAFSHREQGVAQRVTTMAVSSTQLHKHWQARRSDVQLIRNGLMPDYFLPLAAREINRAQPVFGYVGTIAQWFDWAWVIRLANLFPAASVRLIGPCYVALPENLPSNIEVLPACDHAAAIAAMKSFTIGLIPFHLNQLTASVDPIKFYEYRALGIPVVTTAFGEMLQHQFQAGTFLSRSENDIGDLVSAALIYSDTDEQRMTFIAENSWATRFDDLVF
jgi:glycosyltransferase involved in cell wall biosynthesis